jgi:hypothetical protein
MWKSMPIGYEPVSATVDQPRALSNPRSLPHGAVAEAQQVGRTIATDARYPQAPPGKPPRRPPPEQRGPGNLQGSGIATSREWPR